MTYAVFLRVVNLGGHNKMPMRELRAWLEELGFSGVQTHLQTGNVWLESARTDAEEIARAVEGLLERRGYQKVSAMVRTEGQLRDLLGCAPFAGGAEGYRYVSFLRRPSGLAFPPHPNLDVRLVRPLEVVTLLDKSPAGSVALSPNGYLEAKLGVASTSRYWNVLEAFAGLRR